MAKSQRPVGMDKLSSSVHPSKEYSLTSNLNRCFCRSRRDMRPYISSLGGGAHVEYKTRQVAFTSELLTDWNLKNKLKDRIPLLFSKGLWLFDKSLVRFSNSSNFSAIIKVDSNQQSGMSSKHLSPSSVQFLYVFTG